MIENVTHKPPFWFWLASAIGLLWNAMGVNQYLQQVYNTEHFQNMYSQEQLDVVANTPAWVTAAFAIAVFTGVFGFVFILFRKKTGLNLLQVSLLAVIIQMSAIFIYNFISNSVISVIIVVFAIISVVFAKMCVKKGWLK